MSVLALNTLMWNTRNECAMQGPQIEAQFNWLEQQLSSAKDGLKFILTSHIYAGQQYWVNDESNVWDQWDDDFLTRYANIVKKYKDNILIEICGHDHIADFRFSNQQYSPSKDGDYLVHNMIIAPAVTSASYSQPGYLFFNMDETTLQASDIRLVFLPIEQTYLQKGDPSEKFMFRTVDLKRFGLKDLSLQSFQTMKGLLMEDNNLLIRYMVLKRGFDPDVKSEYDYAIGKYQDSDILDDDLDGRKFLCQISASFVPGELEACLASITLPKQSSFLSN